MILDNDIMIGRNNPNNSNELTRLPFKMFFTKHGFAVQKNSPFKKIFDKVWVLFVDDSGCINVSSNVKS